MARPSTRDNTIWRLIDAMIDGTAHLDAQGRGIALTVLLRALNRRNPALALTPANAAVAATDARTLAEVLSKLPAELSDLDPDRGRAHFPYVEQVLHRHTQFCAVRRAAAQERWSRPAPNQLPADALDQAVAEAAEPQQRLSGGGERVLAFPPQPGFSPSVRMFRQLMVLISEISQRQDWTGNITQTRLGVCRLWSTIYRDGNPDALLRAAAACRVLPKLPDDLAHWIATRAHEYAAAAALLLPPGDPDRAASPESVDRHGASNQ